MHFRHMLRSSTVFRAPEDDQGATFEDDFDEAGDEDEVEPETDEEDDPDPEGDEPDGQETEPEPRQSRGQNRVQRLAADLKAEREARERTERELAEARRTPQAQVSPEEATRRREAHLATLTAEGRLEFLRQEGEQRLNHRLNQIEFQSWDNADAAKFEALCARNPTANALKSAVDKRLKELRDQGQNASRDTVLRYVIGDQALNKQPKARAAARRREAEGQERQTARPVQSRGDVARGSARSTNEREARRKRLENVQI